MKITESQIEERLMRMGIEARYLTITSKALDMNELRKIAIKQLSKEAEEYNQLQVKDYQEWIDRIKTSPNELHSIIVFRNNIPTVERYVGKEVLDVINQYQVRYLHSTNPVFTA